MIKILKIMCLFFLVFVYGSSLATADKQTIQSKLPAPVIKTFSCDTVIQTANAYKKDYVLCNLDGFVIYYNNSNGIVEIDWSRNSGFFSCDGISQGDYYSIYTGSGNLSCNHPVTQNGDYIREDWATNSSVMTDMSILGKTIYHGTQYSGHLKAKKQTFDGNYAPYSSSMIISAKLTEASYYFTYIN